MVHSLRRLVVAMCVVASGLALTPRGQVQAGTARHPGNLPTGNLSVVIIFEPATLDPALNYDVGGEAILSNCYDTLVRAVGPKKVNIVPDLATSWTKSPNGKVWTFRLRKNVLFHDGSPMNAAAVKFSFDRLLKAKTGAYADFAEIKSVEVVNPLTVRFRLQYAFSSFLASLASLWGADIVSPKTAAGHPIAPNKPSILDKVDAGSGPYRLAKWVHHQKMILQAFPGYWRGWSGRHIAQVSITWPASSSTQRLELERGGIDATDNLTTQDFDAVSHSAGITVHEYTAQTIRDIRINTTKPGLNNRLIRQALNYAFDYEGVVRGVYQGHATRMRGVGPTGLKNYVGEKHPYVFNLKKAAALIKQSGVASNALNYTIAYLPDDVQGSQMAQIYQSDLKKIGITTQLQGIPIATYSKVVSKPSTNPDIWIGAWTMDYPDDAQMYYSYYYSKNIPPVGGNVMYYRDPTTDRLLNSALRQPNTLTAYRLFAQLCHRVYAAAPNVWTVQPTERVALRSDIHGYTYNFLYGANFYPLYNMWRS